MCVHVCTVCIDWTGVYYIITGPVNTHYKGSSWSQAISFSASPNLKPVCLCTAHVDLRTCAKVYTCTVVYNFGCVMSC